MSRTNKQLESFIPAFDGSGNVTALVVRVSYNLVDDTDNDTVGRIRTKDIWPTLTQNQKNQAQTALTALVNAAIAAF